MNKSSSDDLPRLQNRQFEIYNLASDLKAKDKMVSAQPLALPKPPNENRGGQLEWQNREV
jgi:hypothetical protein